MESVEQLWGDVEIAVCTVCADYNSGDCQLKDTGRCPLRNHFLGVVEVVRSVTSASYTPYVEALHSSVCPECRYIRTDGTCPRREHGECALDRYHALVVDALEEGLFGNPISIAMARR